MTNLQMRYVVCDLDGTLSNFNHRLRLLGNWDEFNKESSKDPIVPSTLALLRLATAAGWGVIISTARDTKARDLTIAWLKVNQVPFDLLLMREENDKRKDAEVKHDHYCHFMKDKIIMFVLEDRDEPTAMWRGLGLSCFQVCKGAY